MRVLVFTSCTGDKAVKSATGLRVEDFDDPERLAKREAELGPLLRQAGAMYTGDQHVWAMRGVHAIRARLGVGVVNLAILSAGYGVVDESRLIGPYDVTFQGMSPSDIQALGARRGVPAAARELLPGHDVVFVLLGSDYLTALDPPLYPTRDQRLVHFAKNAERRVSEDSVVVPAGRAEASRYHAGTVGLKGRMLELIGAAVRRDGEQALQKIKADPTLDTLKELLDREAGHMR